MKTSGRFNPILTVNVSLGPGEYSVYKSGAWIIRQAEEGDVAIGSDGREYVYVPGEGWYNDEDDDYYKILP